VAVPQVQTKGPVTAGHGGQVPLDLRQPPGVGLGRTEQGQMSGYVDRHLVAGRGAAARQLVTPWLRDVDRDPDEHGGQLSRPAGARKPTCW
jgi:hypothetical protein